MNMFKFLAVVKAGLIFVAALASTVVVLGGCGLGVLLWVPAGWVLAGLPAIVLGCIAFEGFKETEKR